MTLEIVPPVYDRWERSGRLWRGAWVAALLLWLVAIEAGQLAAMPQEGGAGATTVDLGFDMAEAGLEVSLPIQLKAPGGAQVGTTINEVAFPAQWLQFQEVRIGPSIEAEVTVSLKQDQGDHKVVEVTVTAAQGQGLTNGIVAFVVFKVVDEVQEGHLLTLRNVARALSMDVPPIPIEPVTGRDGEIELLASSPAVIACFFYMH